jgi:transposase InsO family protein
MNKHSPRFPVEMMSKALGVSRGGYYKWLKKNAQDSTLAASDQCLNKEIKAVFEHSKSTYGSPRVYQKLQTLADGLSVSKSTVARRMKALGLAARNRKRKYVVTTQSDHPYAASPNLLDRQFGVEQINQVWVSDITYIATDQGWRYLTIILDLGDRSVVSWALSTTLHAQSSVIKAFKEAVEKRNISKNSGLMFHSDRGVQYACEDFRSLLNQYKVTQSMSRKGNCWDNAVAESFFKTIKTEELDQHQLIKAEQLFSLIFKYIDGWYNTQRIHSALNGKTPWEVFYEKCFELAA